jgi:hypothetical protein
VPDHGGLIHQLDTGPISYFWSAPHAGAPSRTAGLITPLDIETREPTAEDVHRWHLAPQRVDRDHHRPGRPGDGLHVGRAALSRTTYRAAKVMCDYDPSDDSPAEPSITAEPESGRQKPPFLTTGGYAHAPQADRLPAKAE